MTNEEAAAALIAAAQRDWAVRTELKTNGKLFDGYHPEMEAVHLENATLLESIIDSIGWPGRSKLGDDGAGAAFMILQHAISRPGLQRRALELILEAVPAGDANPLDAAFLSDRIALYEGREQLFGTQFDIDERGLLSPIPIQDPDHVDERRADLGLLPMNETIATMRAQAAADGAKPPPPKVS